ncbi:MAG: phospholipid carrier-dependent glycosyltransferase [Bacteroidales bacterium]
MNSKNILLAIKQEPWKWIFILLATIALFAMVRMSLDAGASGDEITHQTQAKAVYDFYRTMGKDTTAIAFSETNNLPQYGQVVDNLAYAVARIFNIEDTILVRHIVNSIFGWLILLFGGLLAYRAGGKWRVAVLALILLFFSPRLLGHALNNMKDLSLATAMLMGVYYMVVFFQEFPKPKKSTYIMLLVSIGFAIAVRIGGLLLIPYLGLFALVYLIKTYSLKSLFSKPNSKYFWLMFKWGFFVSVGGYILALLFWPYAMVSPIAHTTETFGSMSQFAIGIRQLFEGSIQWSDALPWYYTPKFIAITTPIAVLVGALIYMVTGWTKARRFTTFILFFAFAFPVFWIVYSNANVYGGWRHALFAYPTLVVMAALGFDSLVDLFKNKYLRIFFMILPILLLINPIIHTFKNHPYQYVFFNKFIGGTEKAFGNYEMDYYYHSTREAAEWVIKNAEKSPLQTSDKIKVATWHIASVENYFRHDTARFQPTFTRIYQMGNDDWDYAIFTVTGMNPEWLKNSKMFPPSNTVYTVKVDNVPICIVLKRLDKSDMYGYQAMQAGKMDTAVVLLRKALNVNPYNEQALENLADVYTRIGNVDSAYILAAHWASNVPTNTSALNLLANVYFAREDYTNVVLMSNRIKDLSPKDATGYWIAAHAYLRMNNMQMALSELQALIAVRNDFKPAYQLMAQIYQSAGDSQSAQRCMEIVSQLP